MNNNEMQNIENQFTDSLEREELDSLAMDYAEIGLDAILDDGIIQDIPILRTFSSLVKIGANIRDRLYVKKIYGFLTNLRGTTVKQRQEFVEQYCQNPNRFTQAILLILEQSDHFDKCSMIGKIFKSCMLGRITYEDALKLSHMVNRAYWNDLILLFEDINLQINDTNESLVMAGFYRNSGGGGSTRSRHNGGGVTYERTNYGTLIHDIAKT